MEEKRRTKRRRRRLAGRHPLTLGAISLLGLSGYELWIRLEDFWAWTSGIRHLSQVRGTPFLEDLAIIFQAPEMRQLGLKMLFLLWAIVFALICVCLRNRARAAWTLLLLDLALAVGGSLLGLYGLRPADWATTLKLVPLALVAAGCAVNLGHHFLLLRRRRRRGRVEKSAERDVNSIARN